MSRQSSNLNPTTTYTIVCGRLADPNDPIGHHRFKLVLSFAQVWLVRESVYGLYAIRKFEP